MIRILDECTYVDPRFKSTPYLSLTEKAALEDRIFNRVLSGHGKEQPETISTPSTSSSATAVDVDSSEKSEPLGKLLGDMYSSTVAPRKNTG